jgi:hypothetical protein
MVILCTALFSQANQASQQMTKTKVSQSTITNTTRKNSSTLVKNVLSDFDVFESWKLALFGALQSYTLSPLYYAHPCIAQYENEVPEVSLSVCNQHHSSLEVYDIAGKDVVHESFSSSE